MTGQTLSTGQKLLLKALAKKPRLIARVGALRGVVPQLENRRMAERYAPGRSPAKTMLRITQAGVDALAKLKD